MLPSGSLPQVLQLFPSSAQVSPTTKWAVLGLGFEDWKEQSGDRGIAEDRGLGRIVGAKGEDGWVLRMVVFCLKKNCLFCLFFCFLAVFSIF